MACLLFKPRASLPTQLRAQRRLPPAFDPEFIQPVNVAGTDVRLRRSGRPCGDVWGTELRQLRKNPGFSILAVLVLSLGIGANTAVFTVVDAVLLKPLAFADPDRIVSCTSAWPRRGRAPLSCRSRMPWTGGLGVR